MLQDRLDISERRACEIAGQHRSEISERGRTIVGPHGLAGELVQVERAQEHPAATRALRQLGLGPKKRKHKRRRR